MLKSDIRNNEVSRDSLNNLLTEILRLSQQMVCAARKEQWDAVIELENARVPQFESLMMVLDVAEEMPDMIDLCRQSIISLIDMDKEVKELAELQKSVISQGASDLGGCRKAVSAYLDNVTP